MKILEEAATLEPSGSILFGPEESLGDAAEFTLRKGATNVINSPVIRTDRLLNDAVHSCSTVLLVDKALFRGNGGDHFHVLHRC